MDNNTIEKKVDETLSLLDHHKAARTDAWFYTRLKARMTPEPRFLFGRLPVRYWPAVIGVAILILINIVSVLHKTSYNREVLKEQGLALFSEEYSITNNVY